MSTELDAPTGLNEPLRANAWCGSSTAEGLLDQDGAIAWATRTLSVPQQLAGEPIDLANWLDRRVGWGLVVPDDMSMSDADKANGVDLSEPLRSLVKARGDAPILRWRVGLKEGRLTRYYTDRKAADLRLSGERGAGALAVPHYLLIAASPERIPWRIQYRLQLEAFVGRLDLDDDAMGRYVDALLGEWSASGAQRTKPIVWAVDHGHPDITRLMRVTLADRIASALAADLQKEFLLEGGHLVDGRATGAELHAALVARRPVFVMTSSHGATFPLSDPQALRACLGLPVDVNHAVLQLGPLGQWSPDGCIWYAHACCSAGSAAGSEFAGILSAHGDLAQMLSAIAGAGDTVAPLPQALLSAQKPARAFVGHVEPTFDWTLRDNQTGQALSDGLRQTFYDHLHSKARPPLGLAMHPHFRAVAGLLLDHGDAVDALSNHEAGAADRAVRAKLMAMDRAAMVILGDPTVRLPAVA